MRSEGLFASFVERSLGGNIQVSFPHTCNVLLVFPEFEDLPSVILTPVSSSSTASPSAVVESITRKSACILSFGSAEEVNFVISGPPKFENVDTTEVCPVAAG